MNLSRKINFGKIDAEGRGRKINSVDLEIELRNADTDKPEFSASMQTSWVDRYYRRWQTVTYVKSYFLGLFCC